MVPGRRSSSQVSLPGASGRRSLQRRHRFSGQGLFRGRLQSRRNSRSLPRTSEADANQRPQAAAIFVLERPGGLRRSVGCVFSPAGRSSPKLPSSAGRRPCKAASFFSLALCLLPRLVEGCPGLPAATQAEEEPYLSTNGNGARLQFQCRLPDRRGELRTRPPLEIATA